MQAHLSLYEQMTNARLDERYTETWLSLHNKSANMAFDVHGDHHVKNFLEAIGPWESCYRANSFTYLATRRGADFVLVQGMTVGEACGQSPGPAREKSPPC